MTNFEKYKDEILPLAKNNRGFAFHMNKITDCKLSGCKNCIFTGACIANRIKWLYEEYQEPTPKLTRAERGFCEVMQEGWIARDENGSISYHADLPQYAISYKHWRSDLDIVEIPKKCFNFITWESGKVWSIEELLKLEVEDE